MINQYVWVGIAIAVFFVGIGVSYAIFTNTFDPMTMKFQNQDMFDQMMSQNPRMTQQWMDSNMMQTQMQQMMQDPQMRQQMMTMMMQNQEFMQDMMQNNQMMDMMNLNMEDQELMDLYNKDLNPRQIEYPNIVGFNDLHIGAIRHLEPNGDNSKLDTLVHHHCKVYDDMTASCLLFPTGMGDQDKPYGIEYIISSEQYAELSDEEKKYWHYHLTELPRAKAIFPDLTPEELAPIQPILDETYGKVYYFWNIDDKYPIGEPQVLIIQNLPE